MQVNRTQVIFNKSKIVFADTLEECQRYIVNFMRKMTLNGADLLREVNFKTKFLYLLFSKIRCNDCNNVNSENVSRNTTVNNKRFMGANLKKEIFILFLCNLNENYLDD